MGDDRDGVRVKVCGLTDEDDLRLALDLGVDYAGFVFFPGSPRYVEPRLAQAMIRRARTGGPSRTAFAGVFVDEEIGTVRRVRAECGLDVVQLHGRETPSECRGLEVPVWKAVRVRDESSLFEVEAFAGMTVLLDARVDGALGGTGRRIPLALLRRAVGNGRQVVVAGGISADNLAEIWALRPFAVDVSSSLEDRPGRKSETKMREFFAKVRELRGRS